MRDDFDMRAWRILRLHRAVTERFELNGENERLRRAFEAEAVAHIEEPADTQPYDHYWEGYLDAREHILSRLRQAMDAE